MDAEFGTDAPALGAAAAGVEVDGVESGMGFYGFFGRGFGVGTGGPQHRGHDVGVVALRGILGRWWWLSGRAWLGNVGWCNYGGGGLGEGDRGWVFDFGI